MFEVGFTELLLIFALALVVLGPEKLPRVASQVGRWLGRAKAMARQFREQLEAEAATLDPDRDSSRPGAEAQRHRQDPAAPAAAGSQAPASTAASATSSSLPGAGVVGSPPDWATGAAPVDPDAPTQGELPYHDPYADLLHSHGDTVFEGEYRPRGPAEPAAGESVTAGPTASEPERATEPVHERR